MHNLKNFISENPVLFILLLSTIFLIFQMYKTKVTGKAFVVTIYLYIIVALLIVAFIGKYASHMEITDQGNIVKFIITYFILAIGGIIMMVMDNGHTRGPKPQPGVRRRAYNFFISHMGFLLLLLALSLIIGSSFKHASNMTNAALMTSMIVMILTAVVFTSSEEGLIKMSKWLPNLSWLLFGIILIELCFIIFNGNKTIYEIFSLSIVGLFSFFILSNTSALLLESKNLKCQTHTCINYPLKSSQLLLNYINVFVRLLNYK